MREFDTGATRDTDENKLDFDGFLSPLVLHRYAEYLNKHREQADGKLRDSDNWQKGIPLAVYMKSAFRHFFYWWAYHRKADIVLKENIEENLCGLLFNAMGYLHEHLKGDNNAVEIDEPYVFQPGDIVHLHFRSHVDFPWMTPSLQTANYCGKVIKKVHGADNLYAVKFGAKEFNFYSDEMTLLKREDN